MTIFNVSTDSECALPWYDEDLVLLNDRDSASAASLRTVWVTLVLLLLLTFRELE